MAEGNVFGGGERIPRRGPYSAEGKVFGRGEHIWQREAYLAEENEFSKSLLRGKRLWQGESVFSRKMVFVEGTIVGKEEHLGGWGILTRGSIFGRATQWCQSLPVQEYFADCL